MKLTYSFVLIAFNEEHNIAACIQSILAQQSLGNSYEILVVDDGSRDKTPQLVTDMSQHNPRIKLLGDGSNHGRGYGRHKGVRESSGDFVIMIDADIILSKDWLATTLPYLKDHDVAGGIAVPDGDVAYIYRRFSLKPKTVMGSTTITGNNGIYKRAVFAQANFDPLLREGEDVDFNHSLAKTKFTAICIPGLTVEHQEHKSFPRSMQWLYQSGIGATRQLLRFKQVRLPDLAFAATAGTFVLALLLTITSGLAILFIIPLCGLLAAAFMHLRGKFYMSLGWPLRSIGAILTDSILIGCYYVGRLVGFVVFIKHTLTTPARRPIDTRKT